MEKSLEKLVESAKLTGRLDLLIELREWLDEKMRVAEKESDGLREELRKDA